MAFALYYLLKHPEAMRKLRNEVDEVIGHQAPQYKDLTTSRMPYLNGS